MDLPQYLLSHGKKGDGSTDLERLIVRELDGGEDHHPGAVTCIIPQTGSGRLRIYLPELGDAGDGEPPIVHVGDMAIETLIKILDLPQHYYFSWLSSDAADSPYVEKWLHCKKCGHDEYSRIALRFCPAEKDLEDDPDDADWIQLAAECARCQHIEIERAFEA